MIAVMAVAALTANAQQEVGTISVMPRVGVGMSMFNDVYVDGEKIKNNMCMAVGVEAQYQLSDNFAVSAGLDYDYYFGPDTKINNIDKTAKFSYIDIPVMAHATFGNFAIGAGIQPGFKVSAKFGDNDVVNLKSTRFDVPLEATYTFSDNLVFGVRYNLPLTKAYDYETASPKISGVMLTFGYRIGL